jgi:spore coat polysaccharide biosynthesis predicted glycosyltransferase SpsG
VLVYFGGSDPLDATTLALDAMALTPLSRLSLDVVVGPGYRHEARLARQLGSWCDATLHLALPHLAGLLARADLAIGAGGTTTWERMCLGVPSVVLSVADNQRESCESLKRAGLIEYAGALGALDRERLRELLVQVLEDAGRREALSARGLAMVDGLGAMRVADLMLAG